MLIFGMGLGWVECSSPPQFLARPCLTFHPWATNSLPHGHLHTHQSLPFDGSPRSTVIPVDLIVLPNVIASRGSCRVGTFRSELSTARASAYPPIFTLRWLAP